VIGVFALAFEEHVGLADGVRLRVDFLAVEMGGDLLAARGGEFDEGFLGDGEHAARANGAVVEKVSAGSDGIGDGEKDEHRHQADGVAGRPVFAGFFVVFLVELADEFLEDRAHGVVVHAGMFHHAVGIEDGSGAEIDFGIKKFADERAEGVGLRERGELVAEFEIFKDVLNILREAVQVVVL
jgi:hypothetical protein